MDLLDENVAGPVLLQTIYTGLMGQNFRAVTTAHERLRLVAELLADA